MTSQRRRGGVGGLRIDVASLDGQMISREVCRGQSCFSLAEEDIVESSRSDKRASWATLVDVDMDMDVDND